MEEKNIYATVSEIERCTTVDGPGIRTIVFLKGCPLHCMWCHNPEDIAPQVQVGWEQQKCIGCFKCLPACSNNAIAASQKGIITDYNKCRSCGQCVEKCPSTARKMYGKRKTVSQVFDEVIRDKSFFEKTNGGLTVSGGEPLAQPMFTKELFRLCRSEGIHTALDTSGYASREVLEDVLQETDLVLLDLKQADAELHKRYTGVDPALIYANLERINERGVPTWIRTPIVPGYTDQEENITSIAKLLTKTNCVVKWELLPYHSFGEKKYKELQIAYQLQSVKRPTDEKMKSLRDIANNYCGTRILVR